MNSFMNDAGLTSLGRFDGEVKIQDGSSEELLSQELFVNDGTSNSAEEDSDDDEIMIHRIHKTKSKKMLDSDDEDDVSVNHAETFPSSTNEDSPELVETEEVNKSTSILIDDSEDGEKNDTTIIIDDNSDGSSKRDTPVVIEDSDDSNKDDGRGNESGKEARKSVIFESDNDDDKSGDESSSSDDSSSSSDEDDGEPIRLFRSKHESDRNGDLEEDEFEREVSSFANGEVTSDPKSKQKRIPSRDNVLKDLKSETQRLIRESRVNLPYHTPETVSFADYMANRKKLKGELKTTSVGTASSINKPTDDNDAMNNNEVIDLTDGDKKEPTKTANVEVQLDKRMARRKRIEDLLKSRGKSLPRLNVPTMKLHPTGRPEAAAHDLIELGPQKVLPNQVQSFKKRFLSQIKESVKVIESEKPSKSVLSSSSKTNLRMKLREQLQLSMKAKREAERLRKEELRRLDNEEIENEEEAAVEDEEAEMTDYEEDVDTNSESGDIQSHPVEEQAATACSDDDGIINIDDDNDDEMEKNDGDIINIDDDDKIEKNDGDIIRIEDDDKMYKDDGSDISSDVLPNKDLLNSDSSASNKSDNSAQMFNQSSKKLVTDEDDLSSLPLCQEKVTTSSPRSIKDDDCSFFDKSNGAPDSFMATQLTTDSLPTFTSQGFLNESSEKMNPATNQLVQLEAEDNNANDGQPQFNPDLFDVLCSGKFSTQGKDGTDEDANDGRHFFAKVDESSRNNNMENDENSELPKKEFMNNISFMSPIPPSGTRRYPANDSVAQENETQNEQEDDEIKVSKKKPLTRLLFDDDEEEIPTASEDHNSENRTDYFASNFRKINFDDDDNDEDEEDMVIIRKKKEADSTKNYFEEDKKATNVKNFLEAEAELSGDDDGEEDGEDEGEDNDYYEEDEDNGEILPDEEILHQQVNKAHQKQVLDADKRELELLQEVYMPEDPIANRKRRFRWKNESEFTQVLLDDAEEECDDDDVDVEGSERAARLDKEEFLNRLMPDTEDLIDEESRVTRLGKMKIENSRSRMDSQISFRSAVSDSMPLPFPSSRSNSSRSLMFPKIEGSFLHRDQSFHARVAKLPDVQSGKSVVNSDKMIFRRRIDDKKAKLMPKKRVSLLSSEPLAAKRPRELDINENSNSVFDMF